MSVKSSPYLPNEFQFQGQSNNIVKDHVMIEKRNTLSRTPSQQLTDIIMPKTRSKSRMFNIIKSVTILSVVVLTYFQFQQGSSINELMHNFQNNMNLKSDNNNGNGGRAAADIIRTMSFTETPEHTQLFESISQLIIEGGPVFTEETKAEDIVSEKDKIESFQNLKTSKDGSSKLTEKVLLDSHFLTLSEKQQDVLLKAHQGFLAQLYTQMHNLIKVYHHFFDYGKNGVIVYNKMSLNFKESVVLSRLSVDSFLKTGSKKFQTIQVVFHEISPVDEYNLDFVRLCSLTQVQCVKLDKEQATEKLFTDEKLNDSIWKKLVTVFSNRFDRLMIVDSGALFLNNIDTALNFQNENTVFWSEKQDRRLTSPLFYDITSNKNVYGHKRERVRYHKDESFKFYNVIPEELQKEEPAFHDLEDTLVDSTTDSSMVFINKKTNLDTLVLSLYYDYYQTIYYPLLIAADSTSEKVEKSNVEALFAEGSKLNKNQKLISNAFSETMLASSFALNNNHYIVFKNQVPINNGFLNFQPMQDLQTVNEFYNKKLSKFLPASMNLPATTYDPSRFEQYINQEAQIKPVLLTGVDFGEIFNKEKFFQNVFDHEYYLNNNEVDPDLILSDAILSLRKTL